MFFNWLLCILSSGPKQLKTTISTLDSLFHLRALRYAVLLFPSNPCRCWLPPPFVGHRRGSSINMYRLARGDAVDCVARPSTRQHITVTRVTETGECPTFEHHLPCVGCFRKVPFSLRKFCCNFFFLFCSFLFLLLFKFCRWLTIDAAQFIAKMNSRQCCSRRKLKLVTGAKSIH